MGKVLGQRLIDQLKRSEGPTPSDVSLADLVKGETTSELRQACAEVLTFAREPDCSLFQRVRALFFLHAIYSKHLPASFTGKPTYALIPPAGLARMAEREFAEAMDRFAKALEGAPESDALWSAMAGACRERAMQLLREQVTQSVRFYSGNAWMFGKDREPKLTTPLRLGQVLRETTPVRLDLTHSGWSDIFFLAMDYPEGARVLNLSVELGIPSKKIATAPPITTYLELIEEPLIRLRSVDLAATVDVQSVGQLFNFGADDLMLLKAAVVASGLIPYQAEQGKTKLPALLERCLPKGKGISITSHVNSIPKGSRLAVSTNLLGSLIALCMRATGQLPLGEEASLSEEQRRLIASRAILGEWLGGSGGGWQDSGGIWPRAKSIVGQRVGTGSDCRGQLLPQHVEICSQQSFKDHLPKIGLQPSEVTLEEIDANLQKLDDHLVLIHGGMSQDVGPILDMVSQRYLLRSGAEWTARQRLVESYPLIVKALCRGEIKTLAGLTHTNFNRHLRTIIPGATNAFTEAMIARVQKEYGEDFLGFLMLGGMSGGGMGLFFSKEGKHKAVAGGSLEPLLREVKRRFEDSLPFARDPVVMTYRLSDTGTHSTLLNERPQLLDERSPEPKPGARTEDVRVGVTETRVSYRHKLGKALIKSKAAAKFMKPLGATRYVLGMLAEEEGIEVPCCLHQAEITAPNCYEPKGSNPKLAPGEVGYVRPGKGAALWRGGKWQAWQQWTFAEPEQPQGFVVGLEEEE